MTRKLLDVLRVLVAVLAGNVAMSLLITLGFKWLGGVDFHTSSRGVLVLGGLCAFLSALVGGYLAAWISGRYLWVSGALLTVWVSFETVWLATTGRVTDPLWFTVLGALNLIAGILLGTWLRARQAARAEPLPAAA